MARDASSLEVGGDGAAMDAELRSQRAGRQSAQVRGHQLVDLIGPELRGMAPRCPWNGRSQFLSDVRRGSSGASLERGPGRGVRLGQVHG